MKSSAQLSREILSLNGRGYPAYRSLCGCWNFGSYVLSIDHVQSDPFASPSEVSLFLQAPGFPPHLYENRVCKTALEDALLFLFSQKLKTVPFPAAGSKKGRPVSCAEVSQEILERSVCRIDPKNGSLHLSFNVRFPAIGRKILARPLETIFCAQLPEIVNSTLIWDHLSLKDQNYLQKTYELSMDQQEIRRQLEKRNLAAFIADGSILPRRHGASSLPMENAVPFVSAEEDALVLDLPYAGSVRGMAVPLGITLIVGGGYHGKSTLLQALEMGVYDHRLEDGRELVITRSDAVKIRAEDGRAIHQEDISCFIRSLPYGRSTTNFVSEDASGSTSQAAAVVEALEGGSRLLLIDEDTSATNFMIRDQLMSEVISSEEEPIIPYLERIEQLAERGISTILVAGSSGAWFEKAGRILQMKEYLPFDITRKAFEKAALFSSKQEQSHLPFSMPQPRAALPSRLGEERIKVKAQGVQSVSIGHEAVDLRGLEQLVDSQQAAGAARMLIYGARHLMDGALSNADLAEILEQTADQKGMAYFGKGALARPRSYELLGLLNRMRSQTFQPAKEKPQK